MSTGERWRLGHRPALDGLRGYAVLLVIAAHAVPSAFPAAGGVGVTVFFALSGFLITSLLLDELENTGRIDVKAFYVRRARRLLPALVAFVTVTMVFVWAIAPQYVHPDWLVSVALYYSNWYAVADNPIGMLAHTWSLAVEEQFYLLFPLLVVAVGTRSRRWLTVTVVTLVIGSAMWRLGLMIAGASVHRIYNGTDTVACLLLAGCLTAIAVRHRQPSRSRPGVVAAILVVLGLLGLVPASAGARTSVPLFAAILACAALWLLMADEPQPLEAEWLRLVGRRSYGLYLWHYPLLMVIGPLVGHALNIPAVVNVPIWIAASWGMAALSWRFVESPTQRAGTRYGSPPLGLAAANVSRSVRS